MELLNGLINNGEVETKTEGMKLIKEMRKRVLEGEDPEEVLFEYGLEPDYVFDLIGY